jgi:hypothetical protein
MIGIDRDTGATVDDWPQFVQRATRALTTPLGTRQKRPLYGSKLHQVQSRNMGDGQLILAQSYAVEAFYNVENGIDDFKPDTVVAIRGESGIRLRLAGTWHNRKMSFEVAT